MTDWVSQPLEERHAVTRFSCGNAALDEWLRTDALRAQRAGVSRTTVWASAEAATVVAYHSLAPTQLARVDLPSRSLSGGYSTVPGYLIGRLALDRSIQGQGLGTQLLLDAIERVVDASDRVGGRLIAVDAIDDAALRFYEHHGFRAIEGSNRLVMKLATARRAIAE